MTARPSLFLDFAKAPTFFDPRLSFTRATTASYFDARGILRTAPANMPRCAWDPSTGESLGYLAEASGTNLVTYSEQFDNAAWTKTNLTVTANAAVAPDGNTTGDTLAVTAGNGAVSQGFTITAGNQTTVSVFAKPNASNWLWLQVGDGTNTVSCWFNVASGTVGTHTAGAGTCVFQAATIRALPNGWYRCMLTVTTATSTSYTMKASAAANDNTAPANGNSVYAWGAQAEAGTNTAASSYIATTGATATRNSDALSLTLDTSWWNAREGTMLVEGSIPNAPQVVNSYLASLWDGTQNNAIFFYRASGAVPVFRVNVGGVQQASFTGATAWTASENHKLVGAWKAGSFAAAMDGGTILSSSSGSIPTVDTLRLACQNSNSQSLNGYLKRLIYWPWRLSNADLVSLAA